MVRGILRFGCKNIFEICVCSARGGGRFFYFVSVKRFLNIPRTDAFAPKPLGWGGEVERYRRFNAVRPHTAYRICLPCRIYRDRLVPKIDKYGFYLFFSFFFRTHLIISPRCRPGAIEGVQQSNLQRFERVLREKKTTK